MNARGKRAPFLQTRLHLLHTYVRRHPADGVAHHHQGIVLHVLLRWDYNLPGKEEEGEKRTYLDPADALTKHSVFAFCFCSPCSQHAAGKQPENSQTTDQRLTDLLLMIALVNRYMHIFFCSVLSNLMTAEQSECSSKRISFLIFHLDFSFHGAAIICVCVIL